MSTSNLNQSSPSTAAPWNTPWPANELESVSACPVCGSAERTVLHEGLIDNVFFVAPGKWTLHHCVQCSSAYLDPRPSPADIGKAYGTYYTHKPGSLQAADFVGLGTLRRLRRMLANGYLNHRYGTQRQPASKLGVWLALLFPSQRQVLDHQGFRYMPKPMVGQRLLDIGCGNGDFLVLAREAGWQASGLEPDPKAADTARQRGLDVNVGGVEAIASESNRFDAITLSHVIEHVHEPKQLLQAVHRLLKPGGIVYIETPNIESHWAKLFGKNWRGMESPRHLVLFNPNSLTNLLSATDFGDVQMRRHSRAQKSMFILSMRMAAGHSPYIDDGVKLSWIDRIKLARSLIGTNQLEFITLTARKSRIN